ncbi:unnamed protein product [Lampetra fluviatilis]
MAQRLSPKAQTASRRPRFSGDLAAAGSDERGVRIPGTPGAGCRRERGCAVLVWRAGHRDSHKSHNHASNKHRDVDKYKHKSEQKTDSKADSKADSKVDSKVDRKTDHRSDHKSDHKSEQKSEHKSEQKFEHKSDHKSEHRSEHRSEHKSKHKDKDREKERDKEHKSKHGGGSMGSKEHKETSHTSPVIKLEEDDGYGFGAAVTAPARAKQEARAREDRIKKESKPEKRFRADSDDDQPLSKKKSTKREKDDIPSKRKKKDEPEEKWKWWEEERYTDGVRWKFLEHQGPVFAPPYEPLPDDVHFYYNGKPMRLSEKSEEVATFYAKMLDHEYTSKDIFRKNFFKDWRREMTSEERSIISDLSKCNFNEIDEYFKVKTEERKNMTKDEKQMLKEKNEKMTQDFGFCLMDSHKERIGNFRIEPPGLFRGRGDHPKQGMLKRRVLPQDVIINCSRDSKIPVPPPGHKWKEVRHDNKVTWLASWTENVQGQVKYVMLNATSRIKGEKDWQKYEVARKLKTCVEKIRSQYRDDWKSKEMRIRQRAVALYFIDKLALRAGNEKEEGETADTVGCCSLRVEHIKLHEKMDGQEYVVEFDFPGKDSIRYYNKVPVEKRVFKNLQLFMENKQGGDDLFDRLNTSILNKHLQELMDGLTAKVFRTYNASITLQWQLKELTSTEESVPAKILSYNRANRAVAILCNHQRAAPKTFEKSMANLQGKIDGKREQLALAKRELKSAKTDLKVRKDIKSKKVVETRKKAVERMEEQLMKLEVTATDKEENKQIALGTSKLNYLDPRISVAWCKKFGVPLEKIYNKTQREKFAWAVDMAEKDFEF